MSQLPVVNVSVALSTVASATDPLLTVSTTSDSGCASSTTSNESVPALSATTVEPDDSVTVNPAVSSSVQATATSWSANESKASSELPSSTASLTAVASSRSKSSLTPVTVTVWPVSQLPAVKVSVVLSTVVSVSARLLTLSTTAESGCTSSTTENVSVPPSSATAVEPDVSVIVKPAVSSSVQVTATS